jgi:hypothetical protein
LLYIGSFKQETVEKSYPRFSISILNSVIGYAGSS